MPAKWCLGRAISDVMAKKYKYTSRYMQQLK